MTEVEAQTKWCPMARIGMYGEGAAANSIGAVNRDPRDASIAGCIGSGCMMWRWHYLHIQPQASAVQPNSILSDTDGYCGLAGIPGR